MAEEQSQSGAVGDCCRSRLGKPSSSSPLMSQRKYLFVVICLEKSGRDTNVSQHRDLDNLIRPKKPNLKMDCRRILKLYYIIYSIKTSHFHHELQLFMLCIILCGGPGERPVPEILEGPKARDVSYSILFRIQSNVSKEQ